MDWPNIESSGELRSDGIFPNRICDALKLRKEIKQIKLQINEGETMQEQLKGFMTALDAFANAGLAIKKEEMPETGLIMRFLDGDLTLALDKGMAAFGAFANAFRELTKEIDRLPMDLQDEVMRILTAI